MTALEIQLNLQGHTFFLSDRLRYNVIIIGDQQNSLQQNGESKEQKIYLVCHTELLQLVLWSVVLCSSEFAHICPEVNPQSHACGIHFADVSIIDVDALCMGLFTNLLFLSVC